MIQANVETLRRSSPFDRARRPTRAVGRLVFGWARQVITWYTDRRRMRRAVDELMAFDDRMLADIGLTRADIIYAVRRGSRRERDTGSEGRS